MLAKAKETKVDWKRDVNDLNLPAHVKDHLDAVSIEHTQVRQTLDVLRKTRGQRVVGNVKVPASLQQGMTLDGAGVQRRGDIPNILSAED